MHHSKTVIYLLLISALFNSCIEEYKPVLDSKDTSLYVIEGNVNDQEGYQIISVTKSSDIYNPERIPVTGCEVKIYDDHNNTFNAEESENGEYRAYIDKKFLVYGNAFMVEVITPEREVIHSDYDTLRYCPEIDSVYYVIEEFITDNPERPIPGIQFYIDYNGENSNAGRIKFEVEETWKYVTDYPIRWTWDGRRLTIYDPPDYSKSVCWRTTVNTEIYTLSTDNLFMNRYNHFPLQRVTNNSAKLVMGYSILFRQMSISKEAYNYYEKVKDNTIKNGGLYETQPQQIAGNLHNLTNPDSRVLGYFLAAGKSEKRIFISYVEGLTLNTYNPCSPVSLDLGYRILRGLAEPVYLWLEGGTFLLDPMCVDCTSSGGKTSQPDFWPN